MAKRLSGRAQAARVVAIRGRATEMAGEHVARRGIIAAGMKEAAQKQADAALRASADDIKKATKARKDSIVAINAQTAAIKKQSLRFTELYSKIRLAWGAMRGMGRIVKWFTNLAGNQAQAQARLNAVLYATGGAAGFTVQQLGKHADAMQELTEIDDQAVLSVQALLATFKEIRGDEFTRATEAVLDMAVILGDTKSAAIQVGKALNDPIKGVTALGRAGVQFTEQQKEQIKQLLYAGDTVKAQQMILEELESQFGGTAKAVAEAGAGWIRMANSAQDFGERMSGRILPGIQEMNKGLAEAFDTTRVDTWKAVVLDAIDTAAGGIGALASDWSILTGINVERLLRPSKVKTAAATLAEQQAFARGVARHRARPTPPARTKFAPPPKPFAGGTVSYDVAWKMLSSSQAPLIVLGKQAVHEAMTSNEWLAEIVKNQKAFAEAGHLPIAPIVKIEQEAEGKAHAGIGIVWGE